MCLRGPFPSGIPGRYGQNADKKQEADYECIGRKADAEKQMLIVQDAVWNTVTINRAIGRSTWYFVDEFHLLLKEEQTAAYSAEIWKRFRK